VVLKRQIAYINIHGKFSLGKGIHDRQVIRTVCRSKKRKSKMQEKGRESLGITRTCLMVASDGNERIPQKSTYGKR